MAETGVKAPSDITRALIDDSTDEQLSGHGFFGKYLKKHRDMKKKAHDELLKEDLELQARKERLKKEMSERIKADAPVSTQGGVIQKKRKKKTLSERAHQKLIDEQNTKDAWPKRKPKWWCRLASWPSCRTLVRRSTWLLALRERCEPAEIGRASCRERV